MRVFKLLWLLAAAALAAPSSQSEEDISYVRVTLQQHKTNSEKEILVIDTSTSDILASACSLALDTGAFADFSIVADVGLNGNGSIIAGPSTFTVHENVEHSGGIICYRMYDEYESLLLHLRPVAESTHIMDTLPIPFSQENLTQPAHEGELEQRQISPCSMWYPATKLVGDGDPHQNYYHKQLSENLDCGDLDECAVSASTSKSYTIGWTATANVGQWISGGFAVEQNWETGSAYECTGHAHQTICLWYKTAHTAYTVRNGQFNQCTGFNPNDDDSFIMTSPNKGNKGGLHYCVTGYCRSQGQGYWSDYAPAGGP
ncbi:hypothetical protein BO79DRAFT_261412 [Aspergillus costaricaensis CBS 115574]|uniref:Uncharacterized protein n=1 Tax=Aspergillus costaricaensis CBS 115574 TaxID=1448317 RepID=A0ACD1IUW0_9EURO|nr:hypothetical protein BO79DRAFT_261412 [Aspergillus costaricaensis CBS 115574]RAK94345.1 hypothetical protein BO79DRAFT_261412 [Aspergillus costaricaensis CBS 115574]